MEIIIRNPRKVGYSGLRQDSLSPIKESYRIFIDPETLLGGSWVVISGVISPLIWLIKTVTLLTTPRINCINPHEPPSRTQTTTRFPSSTLLPFFFLGSLIKTE